LLRSAAPSPCSGVASLCTGAACCALRVPHPRFVRVGLHPHILERKISPNVFWHQEDARSNPRHYRRRTNPLALESPRASSKRYRTVGNVPIELRRAWADVVERLSPFQSIAAAQLPIGNHAPLAEGVIIQKNVLYVCAG